MHLSFDTGLYICTCTDIICECIRLILCHDLLNPTQRPGVELMVRRLYVLEAAVDRVHDQKSPAAVCCYKAALVAAVENLNRASYPESWLQAEDTEESREATDPSRSRCSQPVACFRQHVSQSIDSREADALPAIPSPGPHPDPNTRAPHGSHRSCLGTTKTINVELRPN